jgi:hypothetical protein
MESNSEKTKYYPYNEPDNEVVKMDGFINSLWMHLLR